MKQEELANKVREFISELKKEGVSVAILTKIDERIEIGLVCTNNELVEMLEELMCRTEKASAGYLGTNFISMGLTLLKFYDKKAYEKVIKIIQYI